MWSQLTEKYGVNTVRKGKEKINPKKLFGNGQRFQQQGDWKSAHDCYRRALEVEPRSLALLTNISLACHMLGQFEAAARYHQTVLAIKPDLTGERYNLGIAYKEMLHLPQSAECYERVLAAEPGNIGALHGLGIVKMMQGFSDEAVQVFRKALMIKPDDLASRSCFLLALNYFPDDPEQLFRAHIEWEKFNTLKTRPDHFKHGECDRPLRIGYVSPDFYNHPVAYFFAPLLANHDKANFEIYCYSDAGRRDGITAYLREHASRWRDTQPLSDESLAAQIRNDRIDILVDLAGHTANNRLRVFASKQAPLQVTYLGYPNTTGLAAMDYRLTDAWADPPGMTEHLHSERLLRLPNGFLCYRPLDGTVLTPPPSVENGYVTFGSFNNLAKVTPEVIELWAKLLLAVPEARLLLKTKPLHDRCTRENVYRKFNACGIERERVELIGWVDSIGAHLGLYSRVDIGLDTFPYNGTTTTCEALWMGVPVISLEGDTHAGRVGVSILSQTGLPELIAADPVNYIETATRLAGDSVQLATMRKALRVRVGESALCDASTLAREIEHGYRDIWTKYCKSAQSEVR